LLTTNPADTGSLDFGDVRVGTSATLAVTADNTAGDAGTTLTGNFPGISTEFSATGSSFSLATTDPAASENYSYTPSARGSDSEGITITSDGGDSDITLTGNGVGPVFDTSIGTSPTTIDLGEVSAGETGSFTLDLSNISTDGDLGALTDLMWVALLSGDPEFSIVGMDNGILEVGETTSLVIAFSPEAGELYSGTLVIATDENAASGDTAGGSQLAFTLTGTGVTVPEPSMFLLGTLGLLGLGFFVRRRRG